MNKKLAVLVGRFQAVDLHAGFCEFIENGLKNYDRTVVFIGSNPAAISRRDPLDYFSRKMMILEKYPHNSLIVNELCDCADDKKWSENLDFLIEKIKNDNESAVLLGNQKTVGDRYFGRFEFRHFEPENKFSEPEKIDNSASRDFRAGVFFAAFHRKYPLVFGTVDIGIFRKNRSEVLLGRKKNEEKWRFPGGFSDPTDPDFESAAHRELAEECGQMMVENWQYRGSGRVVEWRYRNSEDAVLTHFFTADWLEIEPRASDDLAEVRWFAVSDFDIEQMVEEHRFLWNFL